MSWPKGDPVQEDAIRSERVFILRNVNLGLSEREV